MLAGVDEKGEIQVEVERSELPGIGQKYTFRTRKGRMVGLVSHRSGERDLLLYNRQDPDRQCDSVTLTGEEAEALGELLMAARVAEKQADFERHIEGLVTDRIEVVAGSPYDGRTLGDTRARTRTGASVVAVVREGEALPSPDPGFRLRAGDVVIAVGTEQGTRGVSEILAGG